MTVGSIKWSKWTVNGASMKIGCVMRATRQFIAITKHSVSRLCDLLSPHRGDVYSSLMWLKQNNTFPAIQYAKKYVKWVENILNIHDIVCRLYLDDELHLSYFISPTGGLWRCFMDQWATEHTTQRTMLIQAKADKQKSMNICFFITNHKNIQVLLIWSHITQPHLKFKKHLRSTCTFLWDLLL